ncbi:MAG: LexA family transcriptional repressor [Sideroxydans sp.]|nr:LexA family transcriptional repressor [Sideroxydans sp.]
MNPWSTNILQCEEFGEGTVLYRLGVALGAEDLNVLGLKMDVPPKTVATWKRRGSVPYEQVEKVARKHGFSLDYLMLGHGSLHIEDRSASECEEWVRSPMENQTAPEGFILVPHYEVQASAGNGSLVHSEQIVDYLAFKADWVRNTLGVAQKDLALISVKGDSMEPVLSNEDLILVDMRKSRVEDNAIYVLQLDGTLLVKRIQRKLDGTLHVMSDNPRYDAEVVSADLAADLHVLGRVVWSGRRM